MPRHSPCALLSLTFSTELPALHYVILFVCSQLEYFFMNSSILLPYFLTCMTFQDGCHTRLSLVCLFFVQFSRCVVQDQILNSDKYLIYLNSNFNLKFCNFSCYKERSAACTMVPASERDTVTRKIWWALNDSNILPVWLMFSSFYPLNFFFEKIWWAQMDSNHRPHAYQACALTT